jgi:hypothetical protein
MQAYFITGSNYFSIRTQPFVSGAALTLQLQNMLTLKNTSGSINNYSYNTYESLLQWTASISGSLIGGEYRATITSGSTDIWHGSIQVYQTQSNSIDYYNQNSENYKSNISATEYIIMT